MQVNMKEYLGGIIFESGISAENMLLPDINLNPDDIKAILINEAPPQDPNDWFYGKSDSPDMESARALFQKAGVPVNSFDDILKLGIYITTAIKSPKTGYSVDTEIIKAQLPILEAELALFPNLRVIMLMGDVARKAVNMIVKAKTKKNVIPSEATYKIRGNEYFWEGIRVFPSYIMTGGNILIEKSKRDMISDDIKKMMNLI